jgi:hypothetical protein
MMIVLLMAGVFSSCGKYDDFLEDYEYSAVYFGSQQPLRTVVVRHESDFMQIKIGVVLGGVRENPGDQWASFEIAPDLLPAKLTLLPPSYYTMELAGNTVIIPKGKLMGDFPLKINKDLFTADPLATGNNYALPLRLLETSADSILSGSDEDNIAPKNYTIIVIKYIAPESGVYYVKGAQNELESENGNIVPGTARTYYSADLSRNATRTVTTLSLSELSVAGIGALPGSATNMADRFLMTLNSGDVSLAKTGAAGVDVVDLGSVYNSRTKTFTLKYKYYKQSKWYQVDEEMILRQDPELDLRYEEWD